jgi:O-antigen ligase/polysaccharide polymerase Wzy-like membrane protein
VTVAARALRVLVGAVLASWVAIAVVAPEVPRFTAAAAAVIAAATLWNPAVGLMLTAALTPAGALFADAPVRAPEMFAWAFLAIWLLSVWRPLTPERLARTVAIPAACYGAALVASWLMLTLGGASGISMSALPRFVLDSIPTDHLIFSSPEPETWTLLQAATGIALLLASMATIAPDPRLVRRLGWTIMSAVALLAVATLLDVARQWAGMNYEGWFLLRYVRGERFSLPVADLNAAGSLYVLGGIIAAAVAAMDAKRRGPVIALLVAVVPAFWLTGSRTAFVAALAGLLVLVVAQTPQPPTRAQSLAAATGILVLALAGAFTVDWQSDAQGSAASSVRLRSEFMQTSTRMFASAPVFGVGIGKYFDRSAEFMPADLRAVYGNENAHNYFAQQFAELGVVGGALFLWLVCALLVTSWRVVRASTTAAVPGRDASPWFVGLFAAVGAYVLTCVTGHPLLVPETALPFWIAAGSLSRVPDQGQGRRSTAQRVVVVAASVALAAGLTRAFLAYANAAVPPPQSGFHGLETAPDGSTFRWMTRHAVAYVPNEVGFVRLRLRAPTLQAMRPLMIETAVAGEIADRREIPAGQWVTYDIPSRRPALGPFRRVDLRVNQWWAQDVALGSRQARRPITLMVGAIEWIPLVGR